MEPLAQFDSSVLESLFFVRVLSSIGAQTLVVTVAQLVESRIVIPVVVGSSPIGHPTKHAGFETSAKPQNGDIAHI